MPKSKFFLKSLTVWGAIVGILPGLLAAFGVAVPPDLIAEADAWFKLLINGGDQVNEAVGGFMVVVGRWRAGGLNAGLEALAGRGLNALAPLAAVPVVMLALAGCATVLFGEVETPAQEAYQEKAKYVYTAIPARNYVQASDVDHGVVQAVCNLDLVFFEASQGAAAAALGGGDDLTRVLVAMSSGLASLSLEVFGQVAVPRPGEIAQRTVILARVGALSIAEMRIWRKGFVEAKSEDFVTNGRDPTEEEWAQLDGKVEEIHAAIQGACGGEAA